MRLEEQQIEDRTPEARASDHFRRLKRAIVNFEQFDIEANDTREQLTHYSKQELTALKYILSDTGQGEFLDCLRELIREEYERRGLTWIPIQ